MSKKLENQLVKSFEHFAKEKMFTADFFNPFYISQS